MAAHRAPAPAPRPARPSLAGLVAGALVAILLTLGVAPGAAATARTEPPSTLCAQTPPLCSSAAAGAVAGARLGLVDAARAGALNGARLGLADPVDVEQAARRSLTVAVGLLAALGLVLAFTTGDPCGPPGAYRRMIRRRQRIDLERMRQLRAAAEGRARRRRRPL